MKNVMKKIILFCLWCVMVLGYTCNFSLAEELTDAKVDVKLAGALLGAEDNGWATIELYSASKLRHINQIQTFEGEKLEYSFQYVSDGGENLRVVAGDSVYQTVLPQTTEDIALDIEMLSEISMYNGVCTIKGKSNLSASSARILLLSECSEKGAYNPTDILYEQEVDLTDGSIEHSFNVPENVNNGIIMISCGDETAILYDAQLTGNYIRRARYDRVVTDLGLSNEVSPVSEDLSTREIFEKAKSELPDEVRVIEAKDYHCVTEFYVALNGNDSWAGSFEAPFQTLHKAVEVANALSDEIKKNGVAIYLRGGVYNLQKAVSIEGYNSTSGAPLYITAYNDEKVELSFGSKIDSSEFSPISEDMKSRLLSEAAQKKVVEVSLYDLGIDTIPAVSKISLYINGKKMSLARFPNAEEIEVTDVVDSGVDSDGTKRNEFKLRFTEENPNLWSKDNDIRVFGSFTHEWQKKNVNAQILDDNILYGSASSLDKVVSSETAGWPNRYYYYNVFEELDMPGEWYIDRSSGKLYIYPTDDFYTSDIVITENIDNIIKITDSENVVIDGIDIKYSEVVAVVLTNSKNCIVQRCNINSVHCGIYMRDCINSGIIENNISEIGDYRDDESYGVYVTVVWDTREETVDSFIMNRNFVQNNVIIGGMYNSIPLMIKMNNGCVVSHNYVANSSASGIMLSSGFDNIIEYNEICGGPNSVMDAGGVYVHGTHINKANNHIRYNYIHDFSTRQYQRSNGIYFDDSTGFQFAYGNIIKNTPNGVFSNGGRENAVYNNIFYSDRELVEDGRGALKGIWNTSSFSETNGGDLTSISDDTLNRWISRFEDTQNEYKSRYPNLYEYIINVKEIFDDRANGEEITALEKEMTNSGEIYIDKNIIIGNDYYISNEGNVETFEIGENIVSTLDGYTEDIFSQIEGFVVPDFARMGILKNISPQSYLDMVGIKREADEIVISWYPVYGANNYTVEVSTDKSFSSPIETGVTDYSYYKIQNHSYDEQELYCRIKANCIAKSYDDFASPTAVYELNGKILIEDVALSGDKVSFNVTNDYKIDKDIYIMVAEYISDNELALVKINKAEKINVSNSVEYTISSDEADHIKIFVWNNLTSIAPLCASEKVFLKKN